MANKIRFFLMVPVGIFASWLAFEVGLAAYSFLDSPAFIDLGNYLLVLIVPETTFVIVTTMMAPTHKGIVAGSCFLLLLLLPIVLFIFAAEFPNIFPVEFPN